MDELLIFVFKYNHMLYELVVFAGFKICSFPRGTPPFFKKIGEDTIV
jgi:hypothetical protein